MINKKQMLFIGVLLASFLVCFWSTLEGLFHIWTSDDDYSYALLLPLFSAYLIWERKRDIAATPISTNVWGGLSLVLFLIMSTYGILGSSPSAVRPAIPFVILSITLLCFGRSMFKVLCFPLSLLFFMIPLSTGVQAWIGVPLKSISTKLGELLLRISGVPVFVEGNIIDLGVTKLQVVDACSGLRYILPLLACGVIFAYFFEKTRWRQFVLVALTIPIAIFTNGFRIGVTGILTQHYGKGAAEGFFHDFSGWLIFLFAFALLFVFHFFMKGTIRSNPVKTSANISPGKQQSDSMPRNNTAPVVVTALLLILVGLVSFSTAALPRIELPGGFAGFPLVIGSWKGEPTEAIAKDIVKLSGAEEVLSVVYQKEEENKVSLYVGYRGSPFLESENFFHSPNICIPSSGWKVLDMKKHQISGIPNFGSVSVSEMVIEKMGYRQVLYFWFQTKSRTSNDVNINRYHLSLHAIMRDNTYDLFIRPITPLRQGEKVEYAEGRMDQFIREMMPALLQFLKEQKVRS